VPATGSSDHTNEIFTYDLGPATFTQLTDDPAESSYSPSVSGDDDHNGEAFVTDLGVGTNWEQITQTEFGGAGLPALDGTGDRVVFTALNDLVPAVGNTDGSQEAFVHDRQSGLVQQLTDFTVGNADYPSIDASGLLAALQFTSDPNGDNPDHGQEVGLASCGPTGRPSPTTPPGPPTTSRSSGCRRPRWPPVSPRAPSGPRTSSSASRWPTSSTTWPRASAST